VSSCKDDGAAAPPIPVEKVARRWRKALCEKIYACCTPAERMANPMVGSDVQSCQAKLEAETTFFLGDLPTSVAAGRVAYHPDKLATCLADLKARSCDAGQDAARRARRDHDVRGRLRAQGPDRRRLPRVLGLHRRLVRERLRRRHQGRLRRQERGRGRLRRGPGVLLGHLQRRTASASARTPGSGNLCAIGDTDGEH
jgi:hypothetical protein